MWEDNENGLQAECRVREDDAVCGAQRLRLQMTNGKGIQQRGMESGLLRGDDVVWEADGVVLPPIRSECGEHKQPEVDKP